MREQEKIYDMVFVSRVWGGREHNIRLFEKMAKVEGNNKFLAIFNDFDKKQTITTSYKKRLEDAGVPWAQKDMPKGDLWNLMAKSRYVVIRAGKHLCIPWRMTDALCLGSSIILDADPYPQWPKPLINKTHFIGLDIIRPWNTDPAEDKCYNAIPGNLVSILNNMELQKSLSQNAQSYFDQYATPEKVIQYVVDFILARNK